MAQAWHVRRDGHFGEKPMTAREAWTTAPSPENEAAQCKKIALANGGIERMKKEIVGISPRERAYLEQWMVESPEIAREIQQSIAYRADVLEELEKLT